MSVTYFKPRFGFSIDEGGRGANITLLWGGRHRLFFYVYLLGFRWSFAIPQ